MKRRKAVKKLEARLKDFDTSVVAGRSDITKKHPHGFHRPGSNKKG